MKQKDTPIYTKAILFLIVILLYVFIPITLFRIILVSTTIVVVAFQFVKNLSNISVPISTWNKALLEYKGEHHGLGIKDFFKKVNPAAFTNVYTLGALYGSIVSDVPAYNGKQLSDPLTWEKRFRFTLRTILSEMLENNSLDDIELMNTILSESKYVKSTHQLMDHLLDNDLRKDLLLTEKQSDKKSNALFITYLDDIGKIGDEFRKVKFPTQPKPYSMGPRTNQLAFHKYSQHCTLEATNVKRELYVETTWHAFPLIESIGKTCATSTFIQDAINDRLRVLLAVIHNIRSFDTLCRLYDYLQKHEDSPLLNDLENYINSPECIHNPQPTMDTLIHVTNDLVTFINLSSDEQIEQLEKKQLLEKPNISGGSSIADIHTIS